MYFTMKHNMKNKYNITNMNENKQSNNNVEKFNLLQFDYEFYKKIYTDLEKENISTKDECVAHYLTCGMKEDRCCNEQEMIKRYEKNKENATKQMFSYPRIKPEPVKLNILIRTSNRPAYFEKCIQSVLNQEYYNYHVYITYDDNVSLNYLKKYESNPKITFFHVNIDSDKKYKFNLYCNLLLDKVNNGYILFLDDDNTYLGNRVFEIINKELENNSVLCWKFLRPDKMIYPKDVQSNICLGEIDTSGVCFHVSLKKFSSWIDQQYGDFHFYKEIFKNSQKKKFINLTLNATQFNNKIGNYGENQ